MNRKLIFIVVICVLLACAMAFSACKEENPAYEIWLEAGNSGTEEDFLAWLKGNSGEPGKDGADGKSAYEIWLEAGNSGTEEDFAGI